MVSIVRNFRIWISDQIKLRRGNTLAKRILSINSTNRGSTGRIMTQITKLAREAGYDAYMAYARGDEPSDEKSIKIGRKVDIYWHGLVTRITGKHGFSSKRATNIFLEKVDEIKPDLIHLHNVHGYYLNIELLFGPIKRQHYRLSGRQ